MGLGRLLSFIRGSRNGAKLSDVKLDPGGGPNVTAEHFSAPGDDAHPLPGDYVVGVSIQRSGGSAVVGYMDPKNDQKAAAGEKRIYARDGDGKSVAEMWLKNDGSIEVTADSDITVTSGSNITINCTNATINADSVDLGSSGGTGVITMESVCPFTGNPHGDGSTIVKAVK